MHYHLEVIMPPTSDISAALEEILNPFDENNKESRNQFWDWYVIGGRWAGEKESCRYDAEKLEKFYAKCQEANVTVSGVVCGKQKLAPETQIPMVDKMWDALFPTEDGTIVACPIFSHSNNQYDSNDLLACDVCLVEEIPENLTASRVIVASANYDESRLEAKFMTSDSIWNGVNHEDTAWDGKVKSVFGMYKERLEMYKEEYVENHTPKPNWICVTVDYHS